MQICLTMGGLFPPDWCTRTLGALRSLGLTLRVQTNLHMCHRSGTSQTGLRYYLYVTGKPVHGKQSGEMMWHVNLATVLLSSSVDRTDFFCWEPNLRPGSLHCFSKRRGALNSTD